MAEGTPMSARHHRRSQLHQKLGSALNASSGVAQAWPRLAANSGRWVKRTEESANALKLDKATKGSSDGLSRAVAKTSEGHLPGTGDHAAVRSTPTARRPTEDRALPSHRGRGGAPKTTTPSQRAPPRTTRVAAPLQPGPVPPTGYTRSTSGGEYTPASPGPRA